MAFLLPLLLFVLMLNTQLPARDFPPITRIDAIAVQSQVFEATSPRRPVLIRSAQEAADYFPVSDLARLCSEVDFSRQVVLLFAWRGSGQDRLEPVEEDSPPGGLVFVFSPGRTRDLVAHHQVFVLRSDVASSIR